MSVQEIRKAIAALPEDERWELVARLSEQYDDAWDRQMKADAEAGKLDALVRKAEEEIASGRAYPLCFGRLYRMATDMLGSKADARRWLTTPSATLAGQTPLDYADSEPDGVQEVEALLSRLAHGVFV